MIILTTHMMEEAETLADRIMILKNGELITIGNNLQLKSKFDSKYTVEISYAQNTQTQLMEYLSNVIPQQDLSDSKS